jgi:hypothetical protein
VRAQTVTRAVAGAVTAIDRVLRSPIPAVDACRSLAEASSWLAEATTALKAAHPERSRAAAHSNGPGKHEAAGTAYSEYAAPRLRPPSAAIRLRSAARSSAQAERTLERDVAALALTHAAEALTAAACRLARADASLASSANALARSARALSAAAACNMPVPQTCALAKTARE